MAASDKNIVISPQRGSATLSPSIVFTGDGADPISIYALDGTPGSLSFEGSAGQLFSITNNLTSGSIFSVNDVSGIPSIDVDASGLIQIAPLGGTVAIGQSTVTAGQTVDIKGNLRVDGALTITSTANIANLSADFLDGLDSSQFIRSDVNDTVSGTLTMAGGNIVFPAIAGRGVYFGGETSGTSYGFIREVSDGQLEFGSDNVVKFYESDALTLRVDWSMNTGTFNFIGTLREDGNDVWHTGNDGSGSGLDADTLDGYHINAELGPSAAGNFGQWYSHNAYSDANTAPSAWGWTFLYDAVNAPNTSSSQWYRGRFSLGNAYGYGSDSGDYWMEMAIPRYSQGGAPGNLWIRRCENGAEQSWYQVAATVSGNTTWHAGNDGSGSGLDADLLDGQQGSYYQPASTALTTSTTFGGDVSGTYNAIVIADDSHNHIISNVDGLQSALDAKAPLASPALTGTPTAPTATAGTNTTQIATTAFVSTAVSNLVDSAPATLDTLNELAAALGDDPNFATTITNSLATKLSTTTQFGGDVSGTYNAIVVANDSHTHDGRYYTETESDARYLGISAKAADSNLLDGKDHTNFGATLATYGTTAGASGRIRCTAPFNTNSAHMFQIKILLYASYVVHEYVVGGYMYPSTNQWYLPTCIYKGNGTPNIIVGRDSSGKAYISIANGNYTGVKVCDMTRGYQTSVADTYDPWTITIDAGTENSVTPSISKVWHSGNDGSGSGLDADLLDGLNSGNFLRSDANDSFTGTITNSGNFISSAGSVSAANFNKIRLGRNDSQFMSFYGDTDGNAMISISQTSNPKANLRLGYSVDGGATVASLYTFTGSSGTVWHAGNDGSGSGLDADLLDGQQGSYYLNTSSTTQTKSGGLNITGSGKLGIGTTNPGNALTIGAGVGDYYLEVKPPITSTDPSIFYSINRTGGGSTFMDLSLIAKTTRIYVNGVVTPTLTINSSGIFYENSTKIWHAGNDGSGSGLDADTVDGINSGSFLRSDASDTTTGSLTINGSLNVDTINDRTGQQLILNAGEASGKFSGQTGEYVYVNSEQGLYVSTPDRAHSNFESGYTQDITIIRGEYMSISGNTVWHAGNDGSGSGLDADLLDGAQPSVSASNSTIVQRHSSGYIYANYFNTTPNDVTSGVTKVCVETGNDGFIRHGTADAIRSFLNIESGATGDQSASEILTAIKTVDGSGSGLDADTVDGYQGGSLANSTHTATSVSNRAVGWYTVATNAGNRAVARFGIRDTASGRHQSCVFYASHYYGGNSEITVLHSGRYSGTPFRYIRIKEGGTYDGALLQVYIDDATNDLTFYLLGDNFQDSGWVIKNWVADGTDPGGLGNFAALTNVAAQVDLDQVMDGGMVTTGDIYAGGKTSQSLLIGLGNDGAGSGLDADTLDGIQGSNYLRSDQSDTMTGALTMQTSGSLQPVINSTGAQSDLFFRCGNGSYSTIVFGDQSNNIKGGIRFDTASNELSLLGYNFTKRLTIKSDGNVGIGTTNPSTKLHVHGDSYVSGRTSLTTLEWEQSSKTVKEYVGGYAKGYINDNSTVDIIKLGEFNFTGQSQNIFVSGTLTSSAGTTFGTSDFYFSIRKSLAGDPPSVSGYQIITIDPFEPDVFVYRDDSDPDRLILAANAHIAVSTIHQIYWKILIHERADYDFYTNETSNVEITSTSGLTKLSLPKKIYRNFDTNELSFTDKVGIGTNSPTEKLHVVGNIYASGNINSASDAKLKTNIRPIDNSLSGILSLRGVKFNWVDQDASKDQIGVIAQEVEEVFPELVTDNGDVKSVSYGNITAVLIEAIKEQQKQIEELKSEIEGLKNK